MDREQCIRFVQNGKCIQRLVFPIWRVVCNAFSNVSLFWLQCDSDINYSIYREKWLENSKAGRIILIENYSVIFILQKCLSNSIQNCLLMKTVDEFWHFKSHSRNIRHSKLYGFVPSTFYNKYGKSNFFQKLCL